MQSDEDKIAQERKSELKRQLFSAVNRNDRSKTESLLAAGAPPDAQTDDDEHTPVLYKACMLTHLEICQLLLEKGARVNACDYKGRTALLAATHQYRTPSYRLERLVKLLLSYDADVNMADYSDAFNPRTPLYQQAISETPIPEVVHMLTQKGAQLSHGVLGISDGDEEQAQQAIDKIIREFETPYHENVATHQLFRAIYTEEIEDVKEACERGADVDAKSAKSPHIDRGFTPLMLAAHNNNLDITDFLVKNGAPIDTCSTISPEVDALVYAILLKNNTIINYLIDAGAAIKPYHVANFLKYRCNEANILRIFFERTNYYDQLKEKDNKGQTALMREVKSTSPDHATVQALIQWSDVQAEDNDGCDALFWAAWAPITLTQTLIEHGSDVNHQNHNGETVLMRAVSFHNADLVTLLLEQGADALLKDTNGQTALMREVRSTSESSFPDHATVQAIIERSDVKAEDNDGCDALFWAAWAPITLAQTLIKHGSDVNHQNHNGETVLMRAVASKNKDLVTLLLERGANALLKDKNGISALDAAKKQNRNTGILEVFTRDNAKRKLDKWHGSQDFFGGIVVYFLSSMNCANFNQTASFIKRRPLSLFFMIKKLKNSGSKVSTSPLGLFLRTRKLKNSGSKVSTSPPTQPKSL